MSIVHSSIRPVLCHPKLHWLPLIGLATGCYGQGDLLIAELLPDQQPLTAPTRPPSSGAGGSTQEGSETPLTSPLPELDDPSIELPVPIARPAACPEQELSLDQLYSRLQFDILSQDADDRPFIRYLSLADQFIAGHCAEDLALERAALAKGLNMLSVGSRLSQPTAIDADQLLYRVDIRDYDWDRSMQVGEVTHSDGWEAVRRAASFAAIHSGDEAELLMLMAGTDAPWMYAGDFLRTATQLPLYYALTDVDASQTLQDIRLNKFEIETDFNLDREAVIRAGTTSSPFHTTDLLAERHGIEVRSGSYWQFFPLAAEGSMFENPVSLRGGQGTEAAYTLPNGLLGFLLADGTGALPLNPGNRNVPWFSQRFEFGFPTLVDEVRPVVESNPFNYNADDFEAVQSLYPPASQFAAVASDDSAPYLAAVAALGAVGFAADPVFAVVHQLGADVTVTRAAGLLHVSEAIFLANLALLEPALQILGVPGTSVDIEDFAAMFDGAYCLLHANEENRPDPAICEDLLQ